MKCARCNKEHDGSYGSGRFCSEKCARSYSTSKDRNRINTQVSKTLKGKSYPRRKTSRAEYNLSEEVLQRRSADAQRRYKEYISRWKAGLETGVRYGGEAGYRVHHSIREYLFKKYGKKCCKCGWGKKNPWSKRIPLEVNHIDGNSRNNAEENLELICPNCHSLTPNFRGLNRGNGKKLKI